MGRNVALNPIAGLLVWLAVAYTAIWAGPIFFPIAGSTVSLAALLWKLVGASVILLINLALLRRHPGVAVLGLRPGARTFGLLIVGMLGGVLVVGLWLAAFHMLVSFHLVGNTITVGQLLASGAIYLVGALLEELAFRGHALLRLKERYGTIVAVLLVSLAFGVLHLPGMTGMNAVKIIALTGMCSSLFCLAYLVSGSLWAAVGLHAGMNFMLHSILGAGGGRGPSLLKPVYEQSALASYDPAFWCFIIILLAFDVGVVLIWARPRDTRPQQSR